MRVSTTLFFAVGLAIVSGTALAADRLSDPQVTQLVQNIDRQFDQWKDDLERRNLDDAVIKSAAGTIDVRKFLDSMEKDIDLVKERLKPTYGAGPEVTGLLRRASDVERRYQTQPSGEAWKALSAQLANLASAYGLGWPVDANASGEHKMDGELAAEVKQLASASDKLREGGLRAMATAKRPKTERDQAEAMMKQLKQAASQLESNLKNHRAVAADASRVLELSRQALKFANGAGPLAPDASAAQRAVESAMKSVSVAFGIS